MDPAGVSTVKCDGLPGQVVKPMKQIKTKVEVALNTSNVSVTCQLCYGDPKIDGKTLTAQCKTFQNTSNHSGHTET